MIKSFKRFDGCRFWWLLRFVWYPDESNKNLERAQGYEHLDRFRLRYLGNSKGIVSIRLTFQISVVAKQTLQLPFKDLNLCIVLAKAKRTNDPLKKSCLCARRNFAIFIQTFAPKRGWWEHTHKNQGGSEILNTHLSMATKQDAKLLEDTLNFTKEYTQTASSVIYLVSSCKMYRVGDFGTSWGKKEIIWWAKQNAVGGNRFQDSCHRISCSISTTALLENDSPIFAPSLSMSSMFIVLGSNNLIASFNEAIGTILHCFLFHVWCKDEAMNTWSRYAIPMLTWVTLSINQFEWVVNETRTRCMPVQLLLTMSLSNS